MSREIKFRAYSESSKKMLNEIGLHPFISINHTKEDEDSPVYVFPNTGKGEYTLFANGGSLPIMQYTGLTNKSGIDIYEGDIIRCNNQNCVVVFGKKTCGFGYHVKYSTAWNVINKFYRLSTKDEVIGNVYQTPELLTENQPAKTN